jgi:hypothetical protein
MLGLIARFTCRDALAGAEVDWLTLQAGTGTGG